MSISRKLLLFAALPLLYAGFLASCARKERNLIFIAVDDMRADRLSCYGYARPTTPNLDRIASESAVYRTAVSPSSWTLPVFASVFTSVYPHEHGLVNKSRISLALQKLIPAAIPKNLVTLPEYLKEQGYRTAAFTGGAALSSEYGFGRGFDVFSPTADFGSIAESFAKAEKWLSGTGEKPFFLFVHGYDLHSRSGLVPVKPVFSAKKDRRSLLALMARREKLRSLSDRGGPPAPAAELAAISDLYDDRIAGVDAEIGAFLSFLRGKGLLENSVLVIFSDHGEEFGEHGSVGHGRNLYDETVRVPLIVRVPGAAPRAVAEQVSLLDLFPTSAGLLGLELTGSLKKQLRGRYVYPGGKDAVACRDAFGETEYLLYVHRSALRSCRREKYIFDELTGEAEVYDLAADPGEKRSVYGRNGDADYELEAGLFSWKTR